jgi:glycosyltransferase involved in cell wall biosynthesis
MGGLERQIVTISKLLIKNGHEVFIVSLDVIDGTTYFTDPSQQITVIGIGVSSPKVRANTLTRMRRQIKLYRILRKQEIDYCFAFMIGSLYVARMPTLLARIPLVLCERNSPKMYSFLSSQKYRSLRYLSMLTARNVVVQFENYIGKYPFYLRERMRTIPNSVPRLPRSLDENRNQLIFTFAGRLSFQKQVIRLIFGFSQYCANGGTANLEIIGTGEQSKQILEVIKVLKLSERVILRDPNPDITLVLKNSNLLCLFSLWEGFPNVLAEALAMGIPGVGFKECDGVNELLLDEFNGVLVEDRGDDLCIAFGLAKAEELIKSNLLTSVNCISSVSAYSEDLVAVKWQELLNEYT